MTTTTVHTEILEQLGGRRFLAMTGSKNLMYSEKDNNWLSMRLIPNRSGAKFLKIILTVMDCYTLVFSKEKSTYETIGGRKFRVSSELIEVKKIEGVYCDHLQAIFTEVTGLYTNL